MKKLTKAERTILTILKRFTFDGDYVPTHIFGDKPTPGVMGRSPFEIVPENMLLAFANAHGARDTKHTLRQLAVRELIRRHRMPSGPRSNLFYPATWKVRPGVSVRVENGTFQHITILMEKRELPSLSRSTAAWAISAGGLDALNVRATRIIKRRKNAKTFDPAQAYALSVKGRSYREIGNELGCSHTHAGTLVKEGRKLYTPTRTSVRATKHIYENMPDPNARPPDASVAD